jgi:hypothetical protein
MHHSSLAGTPTRAKDRREEGRCLHFVTRFEKKNIELEYTDCLPASNPRACWRPRQREKDSPGTTCKIIFQVLQMIA